MHHHPLESLTRIAGTPMQNAVGVPAWECSFVRRVSGSALSLWPCLSVENAGYSSPSQPLLFIFAIVASLFAIVKDFILRMQICNLHITDFHFYSLTLKLHAVLFTQGAEHAIMN